MGKLFATTRSPVQEPVEVSEQTLPALHPLAWDASPRVSAQPGRRDYPREPSKPDWTSTGIIILSTGTVLFFLVMFLLWYICRKKKNFDEVDQAHHAEPRRRRRS